MVKNVKQQLRNFGVNLREHRILVAISGGADSMLLAWLLRQCGAKIGLAHCNYHLRGEESIGDELFVREFAEKRDIPIWVKTVDKSILTSAENLQQEARNIRYAFFEEVMDREKYDFCATAHHADDNLETLIMSLLNGNTYKMLSSIPAKRERYIRPFLTTTKKEILDFCETNDLSYRTDSSNLKTDYTRNFVRNVLLSPLLQNPAFSPYTLAEKEKHYGLEKDFIATTLAAILPEIVVEDEFIFERFLAKYEKKHLLLCVLQWLKNEGEKEFPPIEQMLKAKVGATFFVKTEKQAYRIIRTRKGLLKTEIAAKNKAEAIQISEEHLASSNLEVMMMGQKVHFEWVNKEEIVWGVKNQFYWDYDKIRFPLTLKTWDKGEGEKMQPFGMKGQKKISDIFADNKYSILEKERAFLITDTEKIILLTNFRISEQVKIEESTVSVLRITIH